MSSDPEMAKWTSAVVHGTDLSLKFRLKLMSRWESMDEWAYSPPLRAFMRLLAFALFCATSVNLVAYLVVDFPLELRKELETLRGGYHFLTRSAGHEHREEQSPVVTQASGNDAVVRNQIRLNPKQLIQQMQPPPAAQDNTVSGSISTYRLLQQLLKRCRLGVYKAVLVSLSLLGLVSSPFYSVACIVDYLRVSYGRTMVSTMTVGAPKLIRTFTIGVAFLVMCGFFSYTYYSQIAIVEDLSCHSPFQCVAKHVLDAIRGDLTSVLGKFTLWSFPPLVPWEDVWHESRTFYIVLSILFWNMLLQPIMQGHIIDTFAELRGQTNAIDTHLETKCLITGLDRLHFTKYPSEWDQCKGGAYALKYLELFSSLLDLHHSEFDGLENSILQALHQGSFSFFPIGAYLAYIRSMLSCDPQVHSLRIDALTMSS